ncbi:MAG TPA: hypothetical protein VE010_16915, partial [Thermoanaerobaculia bacterium]|nr:hypothetical protein [Thermoanaerobaculia bacterium]
MLAALASYAWRGWYARYITDDFCTAGILRERGFLPALQYHRDNWSGRYSYFPVKAALEAIGPITTRVTPTVMMILLGVAVAYALQKLLDPSSRLLTFLGSATVVYALIDSSPSALNIADAGYWETGSVTYILPLILFTFSLGVPGSNLSVRAACAATAVLMFVAGGLSETTLATQAVAAGALLLYGIWRRSRRETWIGGWAVVSTLAALLLMATAGGTVARASVHTDPRPLGATVARTLDYANGFIGWHVLPSGGALLPLMTVAVILGITARRSSPRVAAIGGVTAVAAYVTSFVPSAWLLPWTAPERALDVSNYFMALALFAGATALGMTYRGVKMQLAASVALAVLAAVPCWSIV